MTKAELVDRIAKEANITKAAAGKALSAILGRVTGALKKGERVALAGLGTFSVAKRKARTGRNPRTGKEIKIKAGKAARFRAGKALKDAVK